MSELTIPDGIDERQIKELLESIEDDFASKNLADAVRERL